MKTLKHGDWLKQAIAESFERQTEVMARAKALVVAESKTPEVKESDWPKINKAIFKAFQKMRKNMSTIMHIHLGNKTVALKFR